MKIHRKLYLLVVIAGLIVTACAPAATPAPAVTSIPATSIPPTVIPTDTAIPSPVPTASPSGPAPWSLVAVGDSIPFNSSRDCPLCTGFVDRYAEAITAATGHPVKVQNLSQHTGLQIDDLLQTVGNNPNWQKALANADIIVVGIAHNDVAWGRDDDPCDGPTPDQPDWSKFNPTCAAAAAEIFRPKFESVYAQIVALRGGKPTIFRTINRYNDWAGTINSDGSHVPPEATNATRDVLDAWSSMVCKAAQANSFTCADIYHAFNGPDGLTFSGDLLAKDNTHPSDKGNEVIARVLTDLGYAPLVP
jgi:lysophospholipase L1-like esterase